MSYTYTDELYHFGIKGMKWGVRRYQNEDGSLTPAGRERYGSNSTGTRGSLKGAGHRALAKVYGLNERTYSKSNKTLASMNRAAKEEQLKKADEADEAARKRRASKQAAKTAAKKIKESPEYKAERNAKIKKALIGAAVVGGVALAAYGGYKLYKVNKDYKNRIGTGKFLMDRIEKSGQMMREDAYWAKQATLDAEKYKNIAKAATTDYARNNAIDSVNEAAARARRFAESSDAYARRNSLDMQAYVENLNKLQENPIYRAKAGADVIRRNGVVNTAYDAASRGARSAYGAASRGARSAYEGARNAYGAASRGARSAYDSAGRTMRSVRENNPIARAQESARRDRTTLGVMSSNSARRSHSGLTRAKEELTNQRNTTIRSRRRRVR